MTNSYRNVHYYRMPKKINQVINEAYDILYSGSDNGMAVFDQVAIVKERLTQIFSLNDTFAEISHDIDNIYYQIEDVIDKVRSCRDSFDYNPGRLDEIESRLITDKFIKKKVRRYNRGDFGTTEKG